MKYVSSLKVAALAGYIMLRTLPPLKNNVKFS